MITIEKVYKSFDNNHVLNGVTLSINNGEVYGLIGKNGAGKSTLMNIIAGLISVDSGRCIVNGNATYRTDQLLDVGYLQETPRFFEYLTTGEYLDFLLKNRNPVRKKQLLDLVELPSNANISSLSRGMRQRLGIASAIVNDPKTVLLDEPTSALDPGGRAGVVSIINQLRHERKTILLSTHILSDMEKICDRVGFLSDGIIKKTIKVSDLNKNHDYISISVKDLPAIMDSLQICGVPYEIVDKKVIRFNIKGDPDCKKQKKLFDYLSGINTPLESIHSEVCMLDTIFHEVCE